MEETIKSFNALRNTFLDKELIPFLIRSNPKQLKAIIQIDPIFQLQQKTTIDF